MAALGILILYAFLLLVSLFFFRQAFRSKFRVLKIIFSLIGLSSFSFLIFWVLKLKEEHRKEELQFAGIYYLTNYPNCSNCIAILEKNNTYKVLRDDQICEKGDWRYEVGGDYFIVYMDDNKEQLGSGKFRYEESKNGFDDVK